MRRDALVNDLNNMEDISIVCGKALHSPFEKDGSITDRFLWAISVAVIHLLQIFVLERNRNIMHIEFEYLGQIYDIDAIEFDINISNKECLTIAIKDNHKIVLDIDKIKRFKAICI